MNQQPARERDKMVAREEMQQCNNQPARDGKTRGGTAREGWCDREKTEAASRLERESQETDWLTGEREDQTDPADRTDLTD